MTLGSRLGTVVMFSIAILLFGLGTPCLAQSAPSSSSPIDEHLVANSALSPVATPDPLTADQRRPSMLRQQRRQLRLLLQWVSPPAIGISPSAPTCGFRVCTGQSVLRVTKPAFMYLPVTCSHIFVSD